MINYLSLIKLLVLASIVLVLIKGSSGKSLEKRKWMKVVGKFILWFGCVTSINNFNI